MITAWWDVLKLRREVTVGAGSIDDVQMSLFRAVHGVAGERAVYADPTYYGEITHPSPNLVDLMGKVIVRLGGGARHTAAPALWQLDQAMGGGKSHGLIGLWQVAANPVKMRFTDVGKEAFELAGKIVGAPIVDDLGKPQVVVLACDNMTAGKSNEELDGPGHTLHERFLWRLFGGDFTLYKRYKDHYADKAKLAEALVAVHRPVLILVDEILDYVRQLSASEHKDLAVRDMAFLRALLDTVNDVPNVAMVVVMISSERDPMHLDAEAQGRRTELEALLVRNGKPATVTSHTDFAAILRRRLFDTPPAKEVVHSTVAAFNDAMKGAWADKVFVSLSKGSTDSFDEEVQRCYPFHPSLLALAEQEWSQLAGFQKVRSTIRIFAAAVFIQWQRAKRGEWAPLLIGPGDLPLSASEVREAIIGSGMLGDIRTQANYRQIAATDIVSEDDKGGSARLLDLNRGTTLFTTANPRAAERAATALFLLSVGARPQGRRGATEAELKAACFVPHSAFSLPDAESVLHELQDSTTGLAALERIEGRGAQPARLFLSTRQTVNMLFRAAREAIGDAERDAELAKLAESLSNSGPFRDKKLVEAKSEDVDGRSLREILSTAGIDDARSTRLVVLDPRRFALQDGTDKDVGEALRSAFGIGPDKLAVQWASSAVFAIINTQRRRNARGAITSYLAWSRVSKIDAVRTDEELLQKAKDEVEEAKGAMNTLVKRAFQFVAYLDQGSETDGEGRVERIHRFEQDNQSALDGTIVWKTLAGLGKAFDKEQFTAKALVHNLTENDYGRPLNELRDLFWSAPRLPLLPSGDADLQSAIFAAVQEGSLRLVGNDDNDRSVTRPSDIAVGSSSLTLARPKVAGGATDTAAAGDESTGGEVGGGVPQARGSGGKRKAPEAGSGPTAPRAKEVQVSFSVNTSRSDAEKRHAMYDLMYAVADRVDNDASQLQASHLQVTVKIVVPDGEGLEELKKLATAAGAVASVTEVS
jgi:hypothetical protein